MEPALRPSILISKKKASPTFIWEAFLFAYGVLGIYHFTHINPMDTKAIIPPIIRVSLIDFAAPIIAIVCGVQNGKTINTNPMDAKLIINKYLDQ